MNSSSPDASNLRRPHPLAAALIDRLGARPVQVLEIGTGSGRNTAALAAAGHFVHTISDVVAPHEFPSRGRFQGALTTHALLHGTAESIAPLLARIAQLLDDAAPFYATFGSVRDSRFGIGTRIDDWTFAPESGDEIGVPHVYFDEPHLRALLDRYFAIESLEERNVDEIVGRWAHAERPQGSVHWFVRAARLPARK
jgi:hypothetical protein